MMIKTIYDKIIDRYGVLREQILKMCRAVSEAAELPYEK